MRRGVYAPAKRSRPMHANLERPSSDEVNWCDQAGALAMAKALNAYWAERGYDANARVVSCGFHMQMRGTFYGVRSDIVNGRPTRLLAEHAA